MSRFTAAIARAERDFVPISVLVELTGRCPLDCRHCYLDLRNPPAEMSTAEIVRCLDQLADAGALWLAISGGEVMLRPDLFDVLAHARGRGFAVRLLTSGTRLIDAHAARLARLGLAGVELSIYGARAAVHDDVTRRPGSHAATLAAAGALCRRGVPVLFKAPLLAPVVAERAALVALAARVGATLRFDPAISARRDGGREPTALRPDANALADALAGDESARAPLPPPAEPDDAPCAIARRTARIAPNGDVFPCATYPHPVGNVRCASFADIWWGPSPLLARLRGLRAGELDARCTGCAASGYCNRCLALGLIEHGDERGPVDESCRIAEARKRASRRFLPVLAGP